MMGPAGVVGGKGARLHIDPDEQVIAVGAVNDIGMHRNAVDAIYRQDALKELLDLGGEGSLVGNGSCSFTRI